MLLALHNAWISKARDRYPDGKSPPAPPIVDLPPPAKSVAAQLPQDVLAEEDAGIDEPAIAATDETVTEAPPADGDRLTVDPPEHMKININRAPAARLVPLPTIGQATAQRIVALRQKRPFSDMDDLIQRAKLRLTPDRRTELESLICFDAEMA